jgi:SAM-dependent methyltransferase
LSLVDPRSAWAEFWAAPSTGGCLAGVDADFERAEAAVWQPFAKALPRKARVLDLGTGDGVVLKRLLKLRPDLKLTGVDSAPQLPPAPRGITLKAGVAAESLPFPEGAFDAAVSRYGYEYGDTGRCASETSRVAKNGCALLLVVHHQDSPVVAWNGRRAAALRWAAVDSGLLAQARNYAATRSIARLPIPAPLLDAPRQAARLYPADPVAGEVLTAMLQAMDPRLPPAQSIAALDALDRKAAGELARLTALSQAARNSEGIASLTAELDRAGFAMEAPSPVLDRNGQPLAWRVAGRRRP